MAGKGLRKEGRQKGGKETKGKRYPRDDQVPKRCISLEYAGCSAPPTRKQQQHQKSRSEELSAALASAFSTDETICTGASTFDAYGRGGAADRLQFGYAPSVPAEAVAYHSTIPTETWIAARRKCYRTAIIKQLKLPRPNCEPMTSILKLQEYWRNTEMFEKEVHGRYGVAQDRADDILEAFISRQRAA